MTQALHEGADGNTVLDEPGAVSGPVPPASPPREIPTKKLEDAVADEVLSAFDTLVIGGEIASHAVNDLSYRLATVFVENNRHPERPHTVVLDGKAHKYSSQQIMPLIRTSLKTLLAPPASPKAKDQSVSEQDLRRAARFQKT